MEKIYKVKNITLIDNVIPDGSCGTGYDQYAELLVEYDTGVTQKIIVGYYYQTLNQVFKSVYDVLYGCENPEQTYELLSLAISEITGHSEFNDLPQKYRTKKKCEVGQRKIYRIRKLTPRTCFRLMGVNDSDIDKIFKYPYVLSPNGDWILPNGLTEVDARKMKISESQCYKMAGNSIVVPVLEGIFTQLFRYDTDSLF